MVKKTIIATFVLLLVASMLAIGCAQPAPSPAPSPTPSPAPSPEPAPEIEPIELNFSHHDPPLGPGGRSTAEYAAKIEEATGGKVKITMYPSSALAAGPAQYDSVISGVADMGWSTHGFYAGRFPLSELVQMPYLGIKNATEGSLTLWHLYETFPEVQAEYSDVKVLALTTHQGAPLAFKEQVCSLQELKGKKIRTTAGGSLKWLEAAGAVPMMMPPSDIYTNMEKGVIDGWTIDLIGAEGFKIHEVTNYYLRPYYYVNAFWVAMNKDVWNSLPADVQQAIDSVSGEYAVENIFAATWDRDEPEYIKKMGITEDQFCTLSDADIAQAVKLAEGVWAEEIADRESKGLPAQKIFDELQSFVADYK